MRYLLNFLILLLSLFLFSHFTALSALDAEELNRLISQTLTDPFENISTSKSLHFDINLPANFTFETLVSQIYNTLGEELIVHVVLLGFPDLDLVHYLMNRIQNFSMKIIKNLTKKQMSVSMMYGLSYGVSSSRII